MLQKVCNPSRPLETTKYKLGKSLLLMSLSGASAGLKHGSVNDAERKVRDSLTDSDRGEKLCYNFVKP